MISFLEYYTSQNVPRSQRVHIGQSEKKVDEPSIASTAVLA